MKRRALIMLGLAVLLGISAVYLARGWLESQTKRIAQPEERVALTTVVIAKRPLSFGDQITPEYLQEVPWPAGIVPADSFNKIGEIVQAGGDARVALRSIQVNEPILKTKISGFGGRATLSTLIDKEMRGVTIRVNDVLGVGGFVLPGDYVDVLLTRKRTKDDHITDVLIQNVKVLAIDQEASDDKDKPKVVRAVTLEVSPDQGQKLALAGTVGTLSLSLRHSLNTGPIVHRTIQERDLVDENLARSPEAPKAAAPAKIVRKANPFASVNVVRGTTVKTEEVIIEKPGTFQPRATGAPRRLTPSAPAAAKSAAEASKPDTRASEPRKAPDAVGAPAPKAPGQPIPLWRDKGGKTVQAPGAGTNEVSVQPRALGG